MTKLILYGIGNNFEKYSFTRHNVGHIFLNWFCEKHNCINKTNKNFTFSKIVINEGVTIYLVWSSEYVNNCGKTLRKFLDFFKFKLKDTIVIHDDLDIVFGNYKFKKVGNSGGHNGIKSIINEFKTNEFMRFKIGISKPLNSNKTVGHVLGNFTSEETKILNTDIFAKIDINIHDIF